MTGLEMWEEFCKKNHIDTDTKHDIWKFCGGGPFADEQATIMSFCLTMMKQHVS